MIFCTQLRRKTDPATLHPVVISLDDIKIQFAEPPDGECKGFQIRLKVHTDLNADGTPDILGVPLSKYDVEKIFYAAPGQLPTIDARLRGAGNLMANIRAFCKDQVRAHNEEQAPGGMQETYTDIDTDTV